MNKFGIGVVLLFIALLTVGCNLGNTSEDSRKSMIQSVHPHPTAIEDESGEHLQIAENVREEVEALPAIFDVAVLKGKEEILVAYKVKHLQRFHMKKIEKELMKRLEKKFSDENFVVSSDYKIFIEAIELKEQIKDKKLSEDEAEKRLQKIIEFKKELT